MKQMSKRMRTGLIGLASLLVVSCGLCMIIMIIVPDGGQAEQSTTTTVVEAATAVLEQTAPEEGDAPTPAAETDNEAPLIEVAVVVTSVEPTAVPATEAPPPTATRRATPSPRPTSTPRPTATPNAAATDAAREAATLVAAAQTELLAELDYAKAIQRISVDYKEALDGIFTQSQAASENPYLIINDEWKITTAVYLAAMQVAGDNVRALDPPARFVPVHADLLEAAEHYDLVAQYYAEGVDDLDSTKLQLATAEMQLGSAAIQRATTKLQALSEG